MIYVVQLLAMWFTSAPVLCKWNSSALLSLVLPPVCCHHKCFLLVNALLFSFIYAVRTSVQNGRYTRSSDSHKVQRHRHRHAHARRTPSAENVEVESLTRKRRNRHMTLMKPFWPWPQKASSQPFANLPSH
uniref:Secreted protein n=1 Tax=Ascaris lumbricoides TaxID=6252 RepID=A0A0M3HXK9_ASCLU